MKNITSTILLSLSITGGVFTSCDIDRFPNNYMSTDQVADNQECIKKYTTNSVVAQTAVGPVISMELIAKGIWKAEGVYGPESFESEPFIDLLAEYEFPAGIREMDSEYADYLNEKAFADMAKK